MADEAGHDRRRATGGLASGCAGSVPMAHAPPSNGCRRRDACRHRSAQLAIIVRTVHNALKFTAEAGARTTRSTTRRRLTVTDTGIGIDPRDHAAIFDMFRQGDGSDTRRYGGTGLGLHIVRRFVGQLGGTVGVHSVPDVGSRFTVTLPRRRSDDAAGSRAA
jgi:K+-sensing histidine kinase KdpD